jgi:hypothetical protein
MHDVSWRIHKGRTWEEEHENQAGDQHECSRSGVEARAQAFPKPVQEEISALLRRAKVFYANLLFVFACRFLDIIHVRFSFFINQKNCKFLAYRQAIQHGLEPLAAHLRTREGQRNADAEQRSGDPQAQGQRTAVH